LLGVSAQLTGANKNIKAAIWLLHNSDLYKEEGIALNDNWLHNYNEALTGDIKTTNDVPLPPFSLICDFGKQNTRRNVSKIPSVLCVINILHRNPPITAP